MAHQTPTAEKAQEQVRRRSEWNVPEVETGEVTDATARLGVSGNDLSTQVAALQRLGGAQRVALMRNIGRVQGNQHAQHLVMACRQSQVGHSHDGLTVQARMSVSEPGDEYEQEADQVAERVMRMSEPALPPDEGDGPSSTGVHRSWSTSTAGGVQVAPEVETRIERMRGGGRPLPTSEREFFEPRLGVDLSGVRVHTDGEAVQTARELSARAYTVGSDIAFNAGEYEPGTDRGRRLLAHELAHVVQQGGAGTLKRQQDDKQDKAVEPSSPDDHYETEAVNQQTTKDQAAPSSSSKSPEKSQEHPRPVIQDQGTEHIAKDKERSKKARAETEKSQDKRLESEQKLASVLENVGQASEPSESGEPTLEALTWVDTTIIEQTKSSAQDAQVKKLAADKLVQETSDDLANLDGTEAILPEDIWKAMDLDKLGNITEELDFSEVAVSRETDLIIQRSPDLTLQRQGGILPQGTPEQISVPPLSIDTSPISAAAQAAIGRAGLSQKLKLQEMEIAVMVAVKRVVDYGITARKKLDDQFGITLQTLDSDAEAIKEAIGDRFNKASQNLNALQDGIADRVDQVIQEACRKVDDTVAEYVNKCEPDAISAIQSYYDTMMATPDDGTIPPFGPGEESGYHAKKANAALEAALEVGRAYAEEYRKQGQDVKDVFQGQVRSDLTQMMQNEITGMRDALTTARQDAWDEVDATREEMRQQATELHTQSLTTLDSGIQSTLQDLVSYKTQLTTQLQNAQTLFSGQVKASKDQAIAQAQAALASAQAALAAVIQEASGPGRIFKPGAQEAVNRVAADLQARLALQVAQVATQIMQQGDQMAATVSSIDVRAGSSAYADTFEMTTDNMLAQVIDDGLVAINQNFVNFGTQMTDQAQTGFNSYVQAATDSIQQIQDAANDNLPDFVDTQFKPGLEQAHQQLKSQAQSEGQKAGDAVQPAWKGWVKTFINIVIAVVVTVAIIAIVTATGGVAGIILGVLAGALIGAAGGAVKCIANNLIDGKPPFENIGREIIVGAIGGIITGLTAGVLGVAFRGTLTVGKLVMKEALEVVGDTLKDGVVEIFSQGLEYGWDRIDWGSVVTVTLQSFVINTVTAGIFKGPGIVRAARGAEEAASAASSAAKQVDEGAEQVTTRAGTAWSRPPRTPSEKLAESLKLPEPEAGYRWNMSRRGIPYQQRMPGQGSVLPSPPKFDLPPVQMHLPGMGPIVPSAPQVVESFPARGMTELGDLPRQLELPFPTGPSWWQRFRTTFREEWPGEAVAETPKGLWRPDPRIPPTVFAGNYGTPTVTALAGIVPPSYINAWNVPVPDALQFNPDNWNYHMDQPVPTVAIPEEMEFNFDVDFDPLAVEDAISEAAP